MSESTSSATGSLPPLDLSATAKPPTRKNSIGAKLGTSFRKLVTPRSTTSQGDGTPTSQQSKSIFAREPSTKTTSDVEVGTAAAASKVEAAVSEATSAVTKEVGKVTMEAEEIVSGVVGKMEMPEPVKEVVADNGPSNGSSDKEKLIKAVVVGVVVVVLATVLGVIGGKKEKKVAVPEPVKKKKGWF
jgi:hypothetical protein